MERPPIYPYFYPITRVSKDRNRRALRHGATIPDEIRIAQEARPRFEGHDQPLIHCLGDISLRYWDDADPDAMRMQTELAAQYGVDGFIFDSFMGAKHGKPTNEMGHIIDDSFLKERASNGLFFGLMSIFAGPRAVLPLPTLRYKERKRVYDISRQSVEIIVDKSARHYWTRDEYIRVNDRPYHSVFVPLNRTKSRRDDLHIYETIEYMKEYADKTYGINPYLVAVSQGADQAEPLIKKGADAVTSYALLPDFSAKATPIQDYAMMVDRSEGEWQNMHTRLDVPYVPTVVVGWDATARTSNDIAFENGVGMYPFTPIIHGGTRALFGEMLRRQYAYLKANVPVSEQYIPVNAWNEITEGSSLLPRIRSDGTVDSGLLEEIKAFSEDIVKNNIA